MDLGYHIYMYNVHVEASEQVLSERQFIMRNEELVKSQKRKISFFNKYLMNLHVYLEFR